MITLEDMQAALLKARGDKVEAQARLRKAAAELVETYRESLTPDADKGASLVSTGVLRGGDFTKCPVTLIDIDADRSLNFYLSTVLDSRPNAGFIVSVSISMRENDDFVSVRIEREEVPLLVLKEGTEGRFLESVEAIKATVLEKIERLA
ncbi:hypothetical protein DM735_20520 [Salmonella enterica subsp. enterica serovar Bonariensis]|nr:hypothetical protein [Salmonella enterica]EBV0044938.1 hypothetical protein [Salmonella enterica subsp. enterica serovar Bonariensis]EBG2007852.1 hypothetical protein [Salmonella enterica]EBW9952230.1 hypothetical protein [Salmonella enterica subsp. enterica serovar Bonariensis]EHB3461473.1 hypothetical protein [Salmonella enterica]